MGGVCMSAIASTIESWPIPEPGGEAIPLDDEPINGQPQKQAPAPDRLPLIVATDDESDEFDDDDFDDDFDDNFEDELEDDFEDELADVPEELDDDEFAPDGDDDEEGGPVEFEEDEDF